MSTNKSFFLCFLLLVSCISQAQEILIKISNPDIEGESTLRGHEKEIVAIRYAQETTGCEQTNKGGGGSCKVSSSSFAFDLPISKAVIGLKSALYKGTHIQKVEIFFRKPGNEPFIYYKIILGDVLVSKMTDATNGTSNETQVQFSAGKYYWIYFSQSGTGQPGTPVTFGWDSKLNIPWNGN